MNLKTTFLLLVLAGAGALLWWYGTPPLPPALDPSPRPAPVEEKGTREFLESLQADQIQSIEVRAPSGTTELTRKHDGQWSLPGNWPIRRLEVEKLVGLLTNLRSRFQPQPLHDDRDLQAFGLDHPTVTVKIRGEGEEHTLAFGEPQTDNLENRFSRDTYVRLGKKKEVVRLAPGLVAALNKPTDYYQERRLFQKETVAGQDRRDAVEQLQARKLTVEDKKPDGTHFTLARTGKQWKEAELSEPVRDRLDDEARKALLAGIFDIWAERFVPLDSSDIPNLVGLFSPRLLGDSFSVVTGRFFATQGGLLVRAGLIEPERTITARDDRGNTVTLQIGNVSSRHTKMVPAPQQPGMPPGMPQRMVPMQEEYRFAKLQDNDQIFEIKGEKLKDVFVALDKLRDSRVARFNSADARRIEIKHEAENIVLEKDRDNWKITQPIKADADGSKITDLLTRLSDLHAQGKDIIDKDDPQKYGFAKPEAVVTVTVEEEDKPEGQRDGGAKDKKKTKTRTLTVRVGKHDADKKKLYVMAEDWPRINAVDDSLEPLVQRSALAYRGKRLLDFDAAGVAKIEIDNEGKKITLEHAREGWSLTAPTRGEADLLKVDQLLTNLGHLEAAEFISQEPTKDELEKQYGLGKPPLTARIEFEDANKPPQVLHVGKARGGKGGYFARLADGGPVFAINEELHKELARDALGFRPQVLWQMLPEEIVSLRIHKAGHKDFVLTRTDNIWKISGPFDASALADTVQKMTAELAAPKVENYTAQDAQELAKYGLEKPELTVHIKTVLSKNDNEYALLIGKPVANEGGSRYAKRGNESAIFTIGEALVRAADHAAVDLLDTRLLNLESAKVERLHAQAGDKGLTLEKKGETWRVTESPAGAYAADREAASSLSLIWADLRAQRFADYGKGVEWAKYGLDKPAVRVTVSANNVDQLIDLGKEVPGETGARYARVNQGLGAAVLPVELTRVLERTYLDYVDHDLLKFDSDAVATFQRHMGANVLEVVRGQAEPGKEGAGWQLVKPAREKADEQTMRQLFEELGHLRADRIAAYPAKDLSSFGLESPAALLTLKLKGEQKPAEHLIKLGKPAGDRGARYALVDEGKAVVVLGATLTQQLVGSPLAFRDRVLAHLGSADRLQLQRGPRNAVFSKVDGTWKLTQPLEADAEQESLDDLLGRLSRLRADALVVEKPDAEALKKYGLDRPEASWRVQSGDKEMLSLQIGNKEAKGERRYARLTKGDLVFLLDPRLSQKVLDEYRTRTVWAAPLDALDIQALNYRYARNPFLLEKAGMDWQIVGKPDGRINAATVEDTLAALAGLKLSRYAVDKAANLALFGLDKPELILEVATRSGKRVLHIGNVEGTSRGRYARILDAERSDVFVLDEETCTRLMRDVSAFGKPPARSAAQPAAR